MLTNLDVIWLLAGVLIAVLAQVFYDLFGTIFEDALDKNKALPKYRYLPKFLGGVIVYAVIVIIIIVLWIF